MPRVSVKSTSDLTTVKVLKIADETTLELVSQELHLLPALAVGYLSTLPPCGPDVKQFYRLQGDRT